MDTIKQSNILAAGFLTLLLAFGSEGYGSPSSFASWEKSLTPPAKTPFPAIVPFEAKYRFGWERIPAGDAKVRVVATPSGGRGIFASGGPNRWVRTLWNYEATYEGEAGASGQTPSWFRMHERVENGRMLSEAYFQKGSFTACRRKLDEKKAWKHEELPGIRDLFSAMLFVRSQPLREGDRLRLAVFPDQNPYLVDLAVTGRETLAMNGTPIRAIVFQIQIQSIEMQGEHKGRLTPHRKFHSGKIWMSDDAQRLPLRAEVNLFIGHVFAEVSEWKKL